jgi:hypothetical protein
MELKEPLLTPTMITTNPRIHSMELKGWWHGGHSLTYSLRNPFDGIESKRDFAWNVVGGMVVESIRWN